MSEQKKFDANQPLKVKHLTAEGIKTLEMQFPSDADWIERETRRRDIIEFDSMGEAKTTREEPAAEESELIKKLCPSAGDVDPYEAGRLLDRLGMAIAVNEDNIVSDNRLTVDLKVLGARTVHVFRTPTSRELEVFNSKWVQQNRIDKRRVSSSKNLPLASKLWVAMKEDVRGYVEGGTVPIIHQAAAIYTAFAALQAALDDNRNP